MLLYQVFNFSAQRGETLQREIGQVLRGCLVLKHGLQVLDCVLGILALLVDDGLEGVKLAIDLLHNLLLKTLLVYERRLHILAALDGGVNHLVDLLELRDLLETGLL